MGLGRCEIALSSNMLHGYFQIRIKKAELTLYLNCLLYSFDLLVIKGRRGRFASNRTLSGCVAQKKQKPTEIKTYRNDQIRSPFGGACLMLESVFTAIQMRAAGSGVVLFLSMRSVCWSLTVKKTVRTLTKAARQAVAEKTAYFCKLERALTLSTHKPIH